MIREVGPPDVDAVADLAEAERLLHAAREPRVWLPTATARQLHPLRLLRLLDGGGGLGFVDERDGRLAGVVIAAPAPHGLGWVVEEFYVSSPGEWTTVGRSLLVALAARLEGAGGGLVVPCGAVEPAKAQFLADAGLRRTAWLRHALVRRSSSTPPPAIRALVDADLGPLLRWRREIRTPLPLTPLPGGRGGLALDDGELRAAVVVAGSVAPPVGHELAGSALVIGPFAGASDPLPAEHVVNLAAGAVWLAAGRDDVHLLVICGPADHDVDGALAAAGYDEPLDWWTLGS